MAVKKQKSKKINVKIHFTIRTDKHFSRKHQQPKQVAFIVSNDIIHYRLQCLERVKSSKSATHRKHNKIRVKRLYTTLSKNTIQRSAYDSTQKKHRHLRDFSKIEKSLFYYLYEALQIAQWQVYRKG